MTLELCIERLSQGVTESRPIVCDTMIWYEVAKGTIDPKHLSGLSLVGNLISVFELLTTPNIERAPQLYSKHPLIWMMELCSEMRLVDPMSYAYQKANSSYVPRAQLNVEAINNWISANPSKSHGLNPAAYLKQSHFRNGMAQEFIASFTEDLSKFREKLKEKTFRRRYKSDYVFRNQMAAKGFFEEMCWQLSINIDKQLYPWESVYPYLAGRARYEYLLSLDIDMKIDPNDQRDLWILLYVNPNELYWTFEDRWNTALKEQRLSRFAFLGEQS